MVNDKLPSEQVKENKELLKKSFEKSLKSDRKPHYFRLSERLIF